MRGRNISLVIFVIALVIFFTSGSSIVKRSTSYGFSYPPAQPRVSTGNYSNSNSNPFPNFQNPRGNPNYQWRQPTGNSRGGYDVDVRVGPWASTSVDKDGVRICVLGIGNCRRL